MQSSLRGGMIAAIIPHYGVLIVKNQHRNEYNARCNQHEFYVFTSSLGDIITHNEENAPH